DLELGRNGDEHLLEVAERLDERLLVLCHDEERRRGLAPLLEELDGLLRRRRLERVARDETERARLRVVAQGGAQRGAQRLLVHLDREVARGRREGHAAAGELRRTDRPLTRAAGALLAPRLRA